MIWKFTREPELFGIERESMLPLLNPLSINLSVELSADLRREATKWARFVFLLTVTVAGCSWSCVLW